MLSDLTVLYRDGLVNVLTFDPLSDNTAACDGRPTTKRLEARVYDVAVVINPDLKLHDVTARGSADKPSSDVRVALVCGEGKRDSTEWCESKRDKSASRHLSEQTHQTNQRSEVFRNDPPPACRQRANGRVARSDQKSDVVRARLFGVDVNP